MATRKNTAPARAHSKSKSSAQPRKGPQPLPNAPAPADQPDSYFHPADRTDGQLRAYLASMQFLRGLTFEGDQLDTVVHGRDLIERLAVSADGAAEPSLLLTADEAADVLTFMRCSEPVEPQTWYTESDEDEPSRISGFYQVLAVLERSLRGGKTAEEEALS